MKKTFTILFTVISGFGFCQNVGIGTINPQSKLHVQGSLFVNSQIGVIRLGYPGVNADYLEFTTINGGADMRIKTRSSAGTERYPYFFMQQGRLGINLDTSASYLEPEYALHVIARNKYAIYGVANQFGTDTVAAVVGFANSPTPVPFSAGVRGESNSTNQNGIGVIGIQHGGGWGVAGFARQLGLGGYGAGLYGAVGRALSGGAGTGGYGVLAENYNVSGYAAGFFNYGPGSGKALFTQGDIQLTGIGEGANKVLTSDANGNASWQPVQTGNLYFVHKATAANTSGHITTLNYANPHQTDMVMVTPNYNPVGGPIAYNNHAIGVYWTGVNWTIFNQDFAPIVNTAYNVQVVR